MPQESLVVHVKVLLYFTILKDEYTTNNRLWLLELTSGDDEGQNH